MLDKRSHRIRRMFASVAPRYDLLNRLLSLSIDQRWRRFTRKRLSERLPSNPTILDLCTGTGDLAIELAKLGLVTGCDFCHPMLVRGRAKSKRKGIEREVAFAEGDALLLPFRDESFDAVSIAFGLRNLENYLTGLKEMFRIMNGGGFLAVLEFSVPPWPVFRQVYLLYFTRILPLIGQIVSGREGPYSYLPASVEDFPTPSELKTLLEEAGFSEVVHFSLTGGIAVLHLGKKPARAPDGFKIQSS